MTSTQRENGTAARILTLIYGVSVYSFFFGTFLYLIGFVGNWLVPKSIDSGKLAASTGNAIAVNVFILGLFAIQHTIMARPAFKQWWTRFVPTAIERSTYVLLATAILAVMAWQWRPLPNVIWQVQNPLGIALPVDVGNSPLSIDLGTTQFPTNPIR